METLLIVMRFAQFAAVMTLFGSSLFPFYALRRLEADRSCRALVSVFVWRVALCASLVALVSAAGWLACEAVLMSGEADGYLKRNTLLTVLDSTQFGRIWRWRLVLLAFLPLLLLGLRRHRLPPGPIAAAGFVLVASLAGIGHGAMGTGFDSWIHLCNQGIHMLAASVWVGGLLSLFQTIRLERRHEFGVDILLHALKRFSAVGLSVVLLILASGGLNSWYLVGSIHALLHTPYGHVLMVKVTVFLGMIALALINRLALMPRLVHGADGADLVRYLQRSVALEQVLALLVVAAVSVLGTMTPAFDMQGMNM